MSLDSLAPLRLLLERAEEQAQSLELAWSRSQQHLTQVQAQGQALSDYERQTTERWRAQQAQLRGVALLQAHGEFMHKLAAARVQQLAQAQAAQHACQRAHSQWQQAQVRAAALRRLIEKREAAALRLQTQREQKAQDALLQRSGPAFLFGRLSSIRDFSAGPREFAASSFSA